jgi:hypothetical protein
MNDCKDLAGVADAKFVQPLGLWVNSCKQRTYLLELDVKGESPSDGWGFLISISSIEVWMELIRQLYSV